MVWRDGSDGRPTVSIFEELEGVVRVFTRHVGSLSYSRNVLGMANGRFDSRHLGITQLVMRDQKINFTMEFTIER